MRRESEKKGHVTATSHQKNATKNICEVLHAEQIELCQFKEGKRNNHWTSTRKLGVSCLPFSPLGKSLAILCFRVLNMPSQNCCVTFKPKNYLEILFLVRARTSQANSSISWIRRPWSVPPVNSFVGKFKKSARLLNIASKCVFRQNSQVTNGSIIEIKDLCIPLGNG